MKAKSILDPTFCYVPAVQTDIRKTFARVRAEQKRAAEEQAKLMPVVSLEEIVNSYYGEMISGRVISLKRKP